jgi:multidrug efflux pump subunit AcrA (membrane-fusion protein)
MIARRIAVASVPHLLAAGILLCQNANAWPAPPPTPGAMVIVARAVSGCFSDTIRVTGFLVPREEALVMFDADGYRIAEILVAEGERVTSGQPLARLARLSPDVPATAAASAAGRAPSPPAAPSATTTLRAPVGGIVTRSSAMVGGMASQQAEPLFRIMVNGEIELEVEVPSIHVPKLKRDANQTARVEIENGVAVGGRVRRVPAEVDRTTQLGRARLTLDQTPSLRVGMFSRAMIDASRSCGIAIPRSAVNYQADGTTVQVVRGTKVETRQVRIGLLSDSSVEIRDGLQEGDIVVANAGASLEDGDQAKPIFPEQLDK